MARDITANAITASESGSGYAVVLAAELDFESGVQRVHTGVGPITFPDGRIFQGVGDFANISVVREATEIRTQQLDLTLSGLESDPSLNLATILTENLRERDVTGYLVFIDMSDGTVVDDPITILLALMSNYTIQQGEGVSITLRVEDIMSIWERSSSRRYTNEHQQEDFLGDLGCEFVPQMVEKELKWGRS